MVDRSTSNELVLLRLSFSQNIQAWPWRIFGKISHVHTGWSLRLCRATRTAVTLDSPKLPLADIRTMTVCATKMTITKGTIHGRTHLKFASRGDSRSGYFLFVGTLSLRNRKPPLERTSPVGVLDEGRGLCRSFRPSTGSICLPKASRSIPQNAQPRDRKHRPTTGTVDSKQRNEWNACHHNDRRRVDAVVKPGCVKVKV